MLGDSLRRRNPGARGRAPAHTPRPRPGRGWAVWLPLAVAAAAVPFFVGYLFASVFLFPAPEAADTGVAVPAVKGMRLAEAQAALRSVGLGTVEVTQLPHPHAAEGVVTAQAPLPGQQLRPGSPVRVAISAGVPRVVVPDVVGFSADRAEGLLARLGFQVARQQQFSPEDSGRILRIEPRPGTEWPLPTTIHILVSLGPEFPDTLFTPDTLPPIPPDTGWATAVLADRDGAAGPRRAVIATGRTGAGLAAADVAGGGAGRQ